MSLSMKRALVCGAGGFIGFHLVRRLKELNYWVRGVDQKAFEFGETSADEFLLLDLREKNNCQEALSLDANSGDGFDEVYQLAAEMGGMGYIDAAECSIMTNSALININMINEAVASEVGRYLFASSACVYPDMGPGDEMIDESAAYPALPDNEYGWEKLYAERMALAFDRHYSTQFRIARFQNCYGPFGTWTGGREKAPAALCRKIASVADGGEIEVWGDGTAMRSYTYVSDLVDGVIALMGSELAGPVNIGSDDFVSVNELVATIAEVSGKSFTVKHVDGPVGVMARNHSFEKIWSLGWRAKVPLTDGMRTTYQWIAEQISVK